MNIFEETLAAYFQTTGFGKIRRLRVGIAGLGGLGSNCASYLVRSGFRRFVLCDHDTVEPANLNRQFYFLRQVGMHKTEALKANLEQINPDLDISLETVRVSEENAGRLFSSCEVVVEAFDAACAKEMLARAYSRSGRLFVSASGIAGWADADRITTRRIHERFYLVGDCSTPASAQIPPCAPRVAVAAAKQANIILSWALFR